MGRSSKRGRKLWTAENDQLLKIFVSDSAETWNKISEAHLGRNGKRCLSYLLPSSARVNEPPKRTAWFLKSSPEGGKNGLKLQSCCPQGVRMRLKHIKFYFETAISAGGIFSSANILSNISRNSNVCFLKIRRSYFGKIYLEIIISIKWDYFALTYAILDSINSFSARKSNRNAPSPVLCMPHTSYSSKKFIHIE